MIFQGGRKNADLVQSLAQDARVLGVHVKNAIGELADRFHRIHELPDEM